MPCVFVSLVNNEKRHHNQGRARDLIPPLRLPNPALLTPAFAPSNRSDSKATPCTTTSYPFILDYPDSPEGAPKLSQNQVQCKVLGG
jgi:hypothetical protein